MSTVMLAPELEERLAELREAGWELFDKFDHEVRDRRWHPFVAANYESVLEALIAQRAPGLTFLEWGSATGVITIMADLLGYEAYGIELDASLADLTIVNRPSSIVNEHDPFSPWKNPNGFRN